MAGTNGTDLRPATHTEPPADAPGGGKPARSIASRVFAPFVVLYVFATAILGATIVLGWLWRAAHAAWAQ
jgi:hypothetical protein